MVHYGDYGGPHLSNMKVQQLITTVAIMVALTALPTQSFTFIQPWMGLERTGEDIGSDLAEIKAHSSVLTAVSYEAYNLGPSGSFVDNNFTNVQPELAAYGLKTYAQVSTCCPWGRPQVITWFRQAAANPDAFIGPAMDAIRQKNFDGYNLDIEPLNGTHQDALAYNAFIDAFADKLHAEGKTLTVDVGTWTPFFNVSLLAESKVDKIILMGTYTGTFRLFVEFIDAALAVPGLADSDRLVVGLETVNPNTNQPFGEPELKERFDYLSAKGISQIAIWDAPIPANWWPYLDQHDPVANNQQ